MTFPISGKQTSSRAAVISATMFSFWR